MNNSVCEESLDSNNILSSKLMNGNLIDALQDSEPTNKLQLSSRYTDEDTQDVLRDILRQGHRRPVLGSTIPEVSERDSAMTVSNQTEDQSTTDLKKALSYNRLLMDRIAKLSVDKATQSDMQSSLTKPSDSRRSESITNWTS